MNRTLKEATVKRYQYHSHEQLRAQLQLFLDATTALEGAALPHALRTRPSGLDERTRTLQARHFTSRDRTPRQRARKRGLREFGALLKETSNFLHVLARCKLIMR